MLRTYSHRNCKSKGPNSSSHSGFSTSNKKANINDVPPEILDMIMEYLDMDDLENCKKVNTQWKNVSQRWIKKKPFQDIKRAFQDMKRGLDEISEAIAMLKDLISKGLLDEDDSYDSSDSSDSYDSSDSSDTDSSD